MTVTFDQLLRDPELDQELSPVLVRFLRGRESGLSAKEMAAREAAMPYGWKPSASRVREFIKRGEESLCRLVVAVNTPPLPVTSPLEALDLDGKSMLACLAAGARTAEDLLAVDFPKKFLARTGVGRKALVTVGFAVGDQTGVIPAWVSESGWVRTSIERRTKFKNKYRSDTPT